MQGRARCGICGDEADRSDFARGRQCGICRACVVAGLREVLSRAGEVRDGETTLSAFVDCAVCDDATPPTLLYAPNGTGSPSVCATCLHEGYTLLTQLYELTERRRAFFEASSTSAADLLAGHFPGLGPDDITTTRRSFPRTSRADLQIALDGLFAGKGYRCVGLHASYGRDLDFATVLERGHMAVRVCPLQYADVHVGEARPLRCLQSALWLGEEGGTPVAVLYAHKSDRCGPASWDVEVAVPIGQAGEALASAHLGAIDNAMSASASYRGKVLSLETERSFQGLAVSAVKVHRLETVRREDVILPRRTLDVLDRSILGFVRQRGRLRELGMSVKRGLLFYGPPGTGKTHTLRFLAAALPDHTTLLITAEQMQFLTEYIRLARLLSPSIVVLEDVDLIARQRENLETVEQQMLLNQLLNEMDGLREEAEIIFVLTTNRPESLEAALAGRPGRIDQAIEFPLPDADGRRRLFDLYRRGLDVPSALIDDVVDRTEGVSAAFLKELARKVAQLANTRAPSSPASAEDVDLALREMLFDGGRLNAKLLGARIEG
jgi:hypothetical protein